MVKRYRTRSWRNIVQRQSGELLKGVEALSGSQPAIIRIHTMHTFNTYNSRITRTQTSRKFYQQLPKLILFDTCEDFAAACLYFLLDGGIARDHDA